MSAARRPRRPALLRGVRILPALLRVLLLRLVAALLWPVAWAATLARARPPRWWRRLAGLVLRAGARTRAYAWLLVDVPPRRSSGLVVVHPPPAEPLRRRAVLLRPLSLPGVALLRYLAGVLAGLLALAAWLSRVVAGRHPGGLRAAQWTVQAYVVDLDAWVLLLTPRRPRLPEPDPRLRPGARVPRDGDHSTLPPFPRRLGWAAIAADLTGGLVVSAVFLGAEGTTWLVFCADVAIQVYAPVVALVLAARAGPLTTANFGLHATRPLRSLGWALMLVGLYVVLLMALALLVAPFAADSGGGIVPDGAGTGWTIAFVALGTVVAPVLEEFFYRGFLFQALREHRSTWWAATVSSIAFAAAHLEFAPVTLADRALIGIGLCWLFARTGRLLPGMFAHSMNNAIVIPLVIGWGWQIAVVLPASLLVITLVTTVAARAGR